MHATKRNQCPTIGISNIDLANLIGIRRNSFSHHLVAQKTSDNRSSHPTKLQTTRIRARFQIRTWAETKEGGAGGGAGDGAGDGAGGVKTKTRA